MVQNKPGVGGIEEDPPLVYVETVRETQTPFPSAPPRPQDEWNCPQCTLLNPARKLYCIACFHRHPDLMPSNIGPNQNYDVDDACEDDEGYNPNHVESSAPFEDVTERYVEDRNIVGDAMDDERVASHHQNNSLLPDEEDPFHKKVRRRMRRKRRMVAGGAAGVVAGAILGGGPALLAAGLVGGAVGSRMASKHRERLKDERVALERYEMETRAKVTTAPVS